MLDIFRGLKNLVKVSHIHIDSPVFRLHYSITVMILVAFSLIVTTRQYVGNPIDCVHTKDIPEDVLNTYCWIHSTYTIRNAFHKKVGVEVPYPGVDMSRGKSEDRKYYGYYQWVCFCLFFQDIPSEVLSTYCWVQGTYTIPSAFRRRPGVPTAYPGVAPGIAHGVHQINGIYQSNPLLERKRYPFYQWVIFCLMLQAVLFYTPRWLWKNWEGGKIHALMMDLDVGICSEVEKKQKKKLLLDYLWENLRYHNWWAYRYYLCEVLALGNVIGQMFLMDRFFDGAFLRFGLDVIAFMESDEEDREDPLVFIFPRMTKCTFHKFGVSGEVERHDAVCILPLNVVNEKIYVFLWFWFLILGALSFLTVVYRVLIILSPRIRVYLLRMRYRLINRDDIDAIVRRSKMGDWFLLYMLGENVDSVIFRDVMHELATRLGHHHHHHHHHHHTAPSHHKSDMLEPA